MKEETMLLDYVLSLSYADKPIEEKKEFEFIQKNADASYLEKIMWYQKELENLRQPLKYFINKEYNLLHYLLMENNQITSFQTMSDCLKKLESDQVLELLSLYLFESQTPFEVELLSKTSLSDSSKWYITELTFNFDALKFQFLEAMQESWSRYCQIESQIRAAFQEKISQEEKRLASFNEDLYELVFENYISIDDYKKTEEKHILLVCIQDIHFYKKRNVRRIGLGLYSYDYYSYLKNQRGYNQKFREQVLKALADPTRFGILKMINDGIVSNTIIAQRFEITSAAVSYQLKYLLENQLILQEAETKRYRVNKKVISQILAGINKELFLED